MRKVEFDGHVLEVYDSIDEMPIGRYRQMNRYLLVDSGIGSDLAALDARIARVAAFIRKGDKDAAATEMENLRQAVWLIQQGVSPRHHAFAALVATIDGKPRSGDTEAEIEAILERLRDLPEGTLEKELGDVKKKIGEELRLYFPDEFSGSEGKDYYTLLWRRAMGMVEGADVAELEQQLLTFDEPHKFTGSDGEEVRYDREFESMSLAMSRELHKDVKGMTVMEYYNAYEFLRQEAMKAKRAAKR